MRRFLLKIFGKHDPAASRETLRPAVTCGRPDLQPFASAPQPQPFSVQSPEHPPSQPDQGEAESSELKRRQERAVESLLENEALAEGLDDAAANALLDWGIVTAREIVSATAGMEAGQADAITDERLQAVRRLMRSAASLAREENEGDESRRLSLLRQLLDQHAVLSGEPVISREVAALERAWRRAAPASSVDKINHLRRLLAQERHADIRVERER